jgi:hypothetical protein
MVIKPLIKNYLIYQGTTFMLDFDWGIAEYPLVANCKAAMQIRKDIKAEDVICEATTENGKIIISLIENRIKIKIPASETSLFDFDKAVYDIELEFPNHDRFRIVQGQLSLSLEVTRNV